MNLNDLKHIYFLGIGGIGMSALARYFRHLGAQVYGYDKTATDLTRRLESEGMQIHYEEDLSQIPPQVDLVVLTPAVPKDHAELLYFQQHNFPIKKRAEVLGIISRQRRTIAVAGTHGKTTTSSLLTHILHTSGIDCTAFLGGIVVNFDSNFVIGNSDWVVVEADEYDRSFLQLHPEIAIITSLDADHLDIYGTKEEMQRTYFRFAGQVQQALFYKAGLPLPLNDYPQLDWHSYGTEAGECFSYNFKMHPQPMFDYQSPYATLRQVQYQLYGMHNVENMTAAISVALHIGCDPSAVIEAISTFRGIQRRFEKVYADDNCTYIDDYGHHPEELRAAILAARMYYPDQSIVGIFQPHLYTRTRDFADGFAEVLDLLDECLLLDIYPAREQPIPGVSTQTMILNKMHNPNRRLVSKQEALQYVREHEIEVLLTLGAGDIGAMVPDFATILKHKSVQADNATDNR